MTAMMKLMRSTYSQPYAIDADGDGYLKVYSGIPDSEAEELGLIVSRL